MESKTNPKPWTSPGDRSGLGCHYLPVCNCPCGILNQWTTIIVNAGRSSVPSRDFDEIAAGYCKVTQGACVSCCIICIYKFLNVSESCKWLPHKSQHIHYHLSTICLLLPFQLPQRRRRGSCVKPLSYLPQAKIKGLD